VAQDQELFAWFQRIEKKLAARPADPDTLLRLFDRQLHQLRCFKIRGRYWATLQNLHHFVRASWKSFDEGERRSWIAAFRLLVVVSRLITDSNHYGLTTTMSEHFYVRRSPARSLTFIALRESL
jgi:hypothetical protein